MKNGLFVSLALAGGLFVSTTTRAQYASSVAGFNQGNGANPDYNDPTAALGAPSKVTPGLFGGPQMAIFTIDKQSFHQIPEGIATFERMPG